MTTIVFNSTKSFNGFVNTGNLVGYFDLSHDKDGDSQMNESDSKDSSFIDWSYDTDRIEKCSIGRLMAFIDRD